MESTKKSEMKESPSKSLNSTLIGLIKSTSIEPVLFFHMVGIAMEGIISENLFLDRICRTDLEYSSEECNDFLVHSGNKTVEKEVAKVASKFGIYRTIISLVFPVVIATFLGPWSDKHGSKIPLLLPIGGSAVSAGLLALFSYLPELPPVYLLLASVPLSLTGGMVTLVVSAMRFISVMTATDDRSFRFAILEVCWILGAPVGTLTGARLYKLLGFGPVFIIAAACLIVSLCIGIILIEDIKAEDTTDKHKNLFCEVFNPEAIKNTVRVVFVKRKYPKRLLLFMSIVLATIGAIATSGDHACLFLFIRQQFSWNEQQFSVYSTVRPFISSVGLMTITVVGLKVLKLNDKLLAMVGIFGVIVGDIVVAFAPQDPDASWRLYFATCLGMFAGIYSIMVRSMYSKIIPKEDIGKIFTFIIIFESALIPLSARTLFSYIYMSTVNYFPGAFHLVTAGLHATVMSLIGVMYIVERNTDLSEEGVGENGFGQEQRENEAHSGSKQLQD